MSFTVVSLRFKAMGETQPLQQHSHRMIPALLRTGESQKPLLCPPRHDVVGSPLDFPLPPGEAIEGVKEFWLFSPLDSFGEQVSVSPRAGVDPYLQRAKHLQLRELVDQRLLAGVCRPSPALPLLLLLLLLLPLHLLHCIENLLQAHHQIANEPLRARSGVVPLEPPGGLRRIILHLLKGFGNGHSRAVVTDEEQCPHRLGSNRLLLTAQPHRLQLSLPLRAGGGVGHQLLQPGKHASLHAKHLAEPRFQLNQQPLDLLFAKLTKNLFKLRSGILQLFEGPFLLLRGFVALRFLEFPAGLLHSPLGSLEPLAGSSGPRGIVIPFDRR